MKINFNKIISIFLISSFALSANGAVTLNDLTTPKAPAYRLGTGFEIEKEYKEIDLTNQQISKISTYD
jgi:hypothetical protein